MTFNTEEWKDIPGYEGRYQASTEGRIRSVDRIVSVSGRGTRNYRGRVLSPAVADSCGHLGVQLGYRNRHYVHKLVMLTFVGPPPNGTEVCHNNGDPVDNRLCNLRYDTRTGNNIDVYKAGFVRRLSLDDVKNIKSRLNTEWNASKIAREYGVCAHTISDIRTGRTYSWLK